MNRDQNLLFGLFAIQLKRITPAQLVNAGGTWAMDPTKELASILVEQGIMDKAGRELVQGIVDHAVGAHDGDVTKTLTAFGGEEEIETSFAGSIVLTDSGGITKPSAGRVLSDPDAVSGVQEAKGRYVREREHAKGGMGRILVVYDEFLNRDIALKELLPGLPGSDPSNPSNQSTAFMSRFLQEARITGQLEHPSIVPVYELGRRDDNSLYYTMKLVRGKSLGQAIKDSDSARDRLGLLPHFVDLCQAIAYAHSRGVIHRDLKPDNVMVGEFGETVVIDWGLAKSKDREDVHADGLTKTLQMINEGNLEDARNTIYGQALGTPAYMPPEQAKGDLDAIDERSDVYSLGAVLYQLLTGNVPFRGTTLGNTLNRVLTEDPEDIESIEPHAPRELVAICKRAMSKKPSDRYASALELAEEIQRFQSGSLVRAYKYSTGEVVARTIRRHKAVYGTVAMAVISLIVVSVFYMSNLSTANRELAEGNADLSIARDLAEKERGISELERNRAEENLGFARTAVDELFTNISQNQLFDKKGMLPVREELLVSAIKHYKVIVEQIDDNESARHELARNYFRLAEVQNAMGKRDAVFDPLERFLEHIDILNSEGANFDDWKDTPAGMFIGAVPDINGLIPADIPRITRVLDRLTNTFEKLVVQYPDIAALKSVLAAGYYYMAFITQFDKDLSRSLWEKSINQMLEAVALQPSDEKLNTTCAAVSNTILANVDFSIDNNEYYIRVFEMSIRKATSIFEKEEQNREVQNLIVTLNVYYGYMKIAFGDTPGGIALFDIAEELSPDRASFVEGWKANGYFKRAEVYQGLGELDNAIDSYSKALTIRPNAASIYYGRGKVYSEAGRFKEAVADYDSFERFAHIEHPQREQVLVWKTAAQSRLDQYENSINSLGNFGKARAKSGTDESGVSDQ